MRRRVRRCRPDDRRIQSASTLALTVVRGCPAADPRKFGFLHEDGPSTTVTNDQLKGEGS